MSHRSLLLGALSLAFIAGCGSSVIVDDSGEGGSDGSGGVGGDPSVAVGPTVSTHVSVGIASSSAFASSVASSSSGQTEFGDPDLFEQPLGAPAPGRNQFTLAENAVGAFVAARAPSQFSMPGLGRLDAPSTAVVFDGPLPSNEAEFLGYGVASLVIPSVQHPEMFPPAPGTWSVRVEGASPTTEVSVLERRTIDGEFHGGALDVNVFVVPGVGDPDYLRSQIELAFDDFAGITLGDVRFFDAPDSLWAVDENNYFEAQEISAGAPVGQAVTLLAVGYIGGAFEGAAGFSPGAPADPIGHGSASSTLVWWVQNDGFFDSIIVRHETGHYAGLFHTTEFETGSGPTLVDPLDDTPSCPGLGFEGFEDCPDFEHVMFPTGGSGAGILSTSQMAVVRGSAIYRGVFAPGQPPAAPFQGLVGQAITSPRSAPASLTLDGVGAGARHAARATPAALRATLPAAVAALDGFGCGTEAPVDTLIAAAARELPARALVDLARDARLAPLLRMRALLAAGRAAGAPAIEDDLAALAADVTAPDAVRAGALRALERVAPARRAAVAPALRADASRLVRHLAR